MLGRENTTDELLSKSHPRPDIGELELLFDQLDVEELIAGTKRRKGPQGHDKAPMLYAYIAAVILEIEATTDLVRELQRDQDLREACGFGDELPSRPTFSRFFSRLGGLQPLLDSATAGVTGQIAEFLPDFGQSVAVDSSNVYTHSNSRTKTPSDSEAGWTAKTVGEINPQTGQQERRWHFGYKLHLAVDANHNVPITGYTTWARQNDSPTLPDLLDKAEDEHDWFRPQYVMADRGYDSKSNHVDIVNRGSIPVIDIRKVQKGGTREGNYTHEGTPTCVGGAKAVFLGTDTVKGHLYRCPKGGCRLKGRKGVLYCHDEWRESPATNPRVLGPLPRNTAEWKRLYRKRTSVERVFGMLKQFRKLNGHYLRGLRKIAVHTAIILLAHQTRALVNLLLGRKVNQMKRRVS